MKRSEEEFQELFSRIDNGFVGSEEHVYNYQKKYAKVFKGRDTILDIGCGQGAFLKALDEEKLNYCGLDLDQDNVDICKSKGYHAIKYDAFKYLESMPEKFGGISMFHMIEHFDGETALRLLVLIHESLQEGGVLCLITPDFKDVGDHNFWLSSTHVRPYPLAWLANALHEIGFYVNEHGKDNMGGDSYIVGVKRGD